MTKADLVSALQDKGYTRARAKELVEIVLDVIKNGLLTSKVESPIGTFELRDAPKPRRVWRLDRIVTQYQRPKRIVFRPRENWNERG